MRIEKVKLGGFGSFNRGIEVDFGADRLNLVIGRNEAGKSTLMSAIFGVLFGFKDAALQKKFEPWEEHDDYAGQVFVRTDDGRLVVIRRNFVDNTAEIAEIDGETERALFLGSANPRGRSDEDLEYYRRLEEIVGFQDEAVFRGTVFMGQSALETSIDDQIRRLVSGSGSTDFKGALHDLHSRFSDLTMENPWRQRSKARPREIENVAARRNETVARLETAREQFLKTTLLEQEVRALEEKLAKDLADLEDDRATLSYFDRFCKLLKDRDAARERFDEASSRRDRFLASKEAVAAREAELRGELGRFARIGEALPELVAQLKSESRELEAEELALDRERRALRDLVPTPNTRLGLALAGLGVAIGVVVLQLVGTLPGLAAMAVLGAGLFVLGTRLATGYKEKKAELEAKVRERAAGVAARERAIEELIARSDGLLGEGEPDRILAEYRRFRTLTDERAREIAAMKALGAWEDVEATYRRNAEETLRCNGLMEVILRDAPYLTEIADQPMVLAKNVEELKRRIAELERGTAAARDVVTEAKVELARMSGQESHDLPALEDEARRLGRRLEGLEFERDALRVVIDTLEECVEEFQEGDLTRLSEEVSRIFREITQNRYTRVTLSPNMDPMLTKYDATHIHPSDLSQGTRDQLYFAMRVAVARHLSDSVALPFFLDDPFVNFDEERLKVTREMLEVLDDHQIVLVTCDRSYESWSDRILDLDGARAAACAVSERMKLQPEARGEG